MWISKNAEDRKKDFVEAAARLFAEKGYEKTSIGDIIAAVGVTKGSFYHHYQSKQEVVDDIIAALSEDLVRSVRSAFNENLPASEKLVGIVASVVAFREARRGEYVGLYPILSREENHPLARRFQQAVGREVLPMLADVIRQGNAEGVFHVSDESRAAGLILKLSALFKSELAAAGALSPDVTAAEAAFWQDTLERLLGAAQGALPVAAVAAQSIHAWKGVDSHDHP